MVQPGSNAVNVILQKGLQFEAQGSEEAITTLDAGPPLGEGSGMSPMELVLAALGGCTGMDVISILRKKRQEVTDYRLEISGTREPDYPKAYTEISVHHVVTGRNVAVEAVRRSIQLSEERYCPVHAMLSKAAKISSSFEVRSEADAH